MQGSPGGKPRAAGYFRALWPLMLVFAAAGYLGRAAWPVPVLTKTQIGVLFIFLGGVLAWSLWWSGQRLNHFLKGARGEEAVARVLGLLPSSYRVLHGLALSATGRDVDHVVIGPAGVCVIETKNWDGVVTVRDGRILYNEQEPTRSPIEQVKAAASAVREVFAEKGVDVPVHPVICFAAGNLADEATGTSGVSICVPRTLPRLVEDTVEAPVSEEQRVRAGDVLSAMVNHY